MKHRMVLALIGAGFLALAGVAQGQMYPSAPGRDVDSFSPSKKTRPSEATGVEKNGVYDETEVKHSWFSFTKPSEKTPEAQFERAEKLRQAGLFKSAGKAYFALVITWPRSAQAAISQQRYAEMLAVRGLNEDAFDEYDKLIDKYVGSFDYTSIIEEQFKLAQKVMNRRKGKFLLFGGWKAPERAIPMFESILKHAPRWDGAAEAQYMIGVANEMIDEMDLAIVAYMNTQHRYPESPFAEKSGFGRAHCLYVMSEESPNDEETMEQAYAAVVAFLNTYPKSDHVEVATAYRDTLLRKRAEIAYNRAVFYDKVAKQPKAALMTYENFVRMFPNSEWTETARGRIEQLRPLAEKAKK